MNNYPNSCGNINENPGKSMTIVDIQKIFAAGLSFEGAQEVNKAAAMADISLYAHNQKKAIDSYWEHQGQGGPLATTVAITSHAPDLVALSKSFIAEKQLVKKRSTDPRLGRWCYYLKDKEFNRHIPIDENALFGSYSDYVYDQADDPSWDNEKAMKRSFHRMRHSIPSLEESSLTVLPPTKILALDGLFDLETGVFNPSAAYPRGVFSTSSLPIKLCSSNIETPAFDAMLFDSFGGDESLIQRAREMFGALISPVKTKQCFFIFQGVGDAGKTRYARLIVKRILKWLGVYVINDFSELANDELKRADSPYSLVFIRDSVDKLVAPKQRSYLKSYCDGGYDDSEPTYKMLLCTNHALYTGDDGFVEKPLLNRSVVLSFPKPMENTNPLVANFEEFHLEKELPAIVRSCLWAYSKVLQNGGQFSGSCQLNEVVEANAASPLEDPSASSTQLDSSSPTLNDLLGQWLEPIDTPDPAMTTTTILQWIQARCPGLQVSPEIIGRTLREKYGESLVFKRTSAGMCYGFRFRETSKIVN